MSCFSRLAADLGFNANIACGATPASREAPLRRTIANLSFWRHAAGRRKSQIWRSLAPLRQFELNSTFTQFSARRCVDMRVEVRLSRAGDGLLLRSGPARASSRIWDAADSFSELSSTDGYRVSDAERGHAQAPWRQAIEAAEPVTRLPPNDWLHITRHCGSQLSPLAVR